MECVFPKLDIHNTLDYFPFCRISTTQKNKQKCRANVQCTSRYDLHGKSNGNEAHNLDVFSADGIVLGAFDGIIDIGMDSGFDVIVHREGNQWPIVLHEQLFSERMHKQRGIRCLRYVVLGQFKMR